MLKVQKCKQIMKIKVVELFEEHAPTSEVENSGYKYVTVQKGDYTCLVRYSSFNGDSVFEEEPNNYTYYIFAYDEANLRVRYIYCRSMENGADQSYYLSLEW